MTKSISGSHLKKYTALAVCCLGCSTSVLGAGSAHVHGHGQLLIAQEGQQWQLEFNLPAADVVGFEHAAHSEQDKQRLHNVEESLAIPERVFTTLGGNCEVAEQDVDLPGSGHHEADDHHDSHEHEEHADHEGNDEHEGHDEHETQHADVRLRYQLQCHGKLNGITVTLFDIAPSLGEIDVQWIVSAGQGQAEVSPQKRDLVW